MSASSRMCSTSSERCLAPHYPTGKGALWSASDEGQRSPSNGMLWYFARDPVWGGPARIPETVGEAACKSNCGKYPS